ncbi:hypothetical protein ACWD6P_06630 [Streptomyces sp. NPDC002446]
MSAGATGRRPGRRGERLPLVAEGRQTEQVPQAGCDDIEVAFVAALLVLERLELVQLRDGEQASGASCAALREPPDEGGAAG